MRYDAYFDQMEPFRWDGQPLKYIAEDLLKTSSDGKRFAVSGKPLHYWVLVVVPSIAIALTVLLRKVSDKPDITIYHPIVLNCFPSFVGLILISAELFRAWGAKKRETLLR